VKIVSQAMNVATGGTSSSVNADASKGSLQSSFSAVIGATVEAAQQNGDAKLVKAKNVDTKQTSSPESKKKPASFNTGNASAASQAYSSGVPENSAATLVAQVAVPQTVSAVIVDSAVTSKISGDATVASKLAAVQVDSVNGSSELVDSSQANASKADSDLSITPMIAAPPALVAPVENVNSAAAGAVSEVAATKVSVEQSIATVGVPVPRSVEASTDAIASGLPNSEISGLTKQKDLNAPPLPEMKSLRTAVNDKNPATPVTGFTKPMSGVASSHPAANVAVASSVNPTVTAPQGHGRNDALPQPMATFNDSDPVKSNAAPVELPNKQVAEVETATEPVANSQMLAKRQQANLTATAAQTADSQTVALQTGAQQTVTQPLAVPSTAILQSADASFSTDGAGGFKLSGTAPTSGKSAVPSTSGLSVVGKGKTANSDLRSNRSTASTDDDDSSDETDPKVAASSIVLPTTEPGQAMSHVKGAVETAVLAGNAQAAQGSAHASVPPVSSASAPAITSAVSTMVPAQATSAESAPAMHALNSAQLIQSVHGSEMRLGMQSAEFGNISINTTINRETLSAQISMDHSALGHALAMHLPAIEEKLGSAYGLQTKVELRDTGSNSAPNDSSSSESKGDRRPSGGGTGTSTSMLQRSIGGLTSSSFSSSSTSVATASSRLDIRI
jgi:hypothetical protein